MVQAPAPEEALRVVRNSVIWKEERLMTPTAILNWAECPAVESIPGKRSGAWVFRDTRTPVSVVFDNLEVGATIDEIME
jgi:hypothetical protein